MANQDGDRTRKPTAKKAAAGRRPAGGAATATSAGRNATKATVPKPAVKAGGRTQGKGADRPSRRRIAPVKVAQGRAWGPIVVFAAVIAVAASIIGYGAWAVYDKAQTWSDRAARIDGLVNWREKNSKALTADHKTGVVDYSKMPMRPPTGGNHNANWQRCQGDVYDAPIATEHAIHSMEHGAAWITYKPDLPKEQVESLAKLVRGKEYRLMSPYEGQDAPISLQVWGYQLKVNNARDSRIKSFLSTLPQNAAKEPGATCISGSFITETGTTPRDLAPPQEQQPGGGQPGGADPDGGNHGTAPGGGQPGG